MKTEYPCDAQRRGNHLVVRGSGPEPEPYIRQMLTRGAVSALLPASLRAVDGELFYGYEVGELRSLAEAAEGQRFGRAALARLSGEIAEMLRELAEHLLPAEGLLLAPSTIFVDAEGRLRFCYCPRPEEAGRRDVRALAEFLLPRLDRGDREAVLTGYGLCQRLMDGDGSVELLRQGARAAVPEIAAGAVPRPGATPGPGAAKPETPKPGPARVRAAEIAAAPTGPSAEERRRILDSFYAEDEEPAAPKRRLRLNAWQQRLLVIAALVVVAAFLFGAITGDRSLGVGCALITAAAAAMVWLRLARRERSGYTFLKRR